MGRMRRTVRVGLRAVLRGAFLLGILLSLWAPLGAQSGSLVEVLTVEGPITPIVAGYIERGIAQAEADGAEALIIELNTPGGQVSTMENIVQSMALSRVPIVVYVSPPRAQAASAGTFIVLAAQLAAMAPETSIGAASPVGGQGEDLSETLEAKATNILVSLIKNLAERRGEAAAEWAEAAVREAASATAEEALELGVIDHVAVTLSDLLEAIDGQKVEVAGETVTLATRGAAVIPVPMNAIERLLHTLTNPNIAFILMTVGINGIIFELSSPGGYVAGIVGTIALLLGLFALGVLGVDFTGLVFLALAFVLFVAEVFTPTHGILAGGGVLSFILGSLILFNTPFAPVSRGLVVGVGLATGGFFAFALTKALQAQRRQPATGREGLIGSPAVARTPLNPRGRVFVFGEWWDAEAREGRIRKGQEVEVVEMDGFRLIVVPRE